MTQPSPMENHSGLSFRRDPLQGEVFNAEGVSLEYRPEISLAIQKRSETLCFLEKDEP